MESPLDLSFSRIRAYVAAMGWSRRQLAIKADIAHATLRNFHNPDWSPTTSTLRKLLDLVPADFRAPDDRPARRGRSAA